MAPISAHILPFHPVFTSIFGLTLIGTAVGFAAAAVVAFPAGGAAGTAGGFGSEPVLAADAFPADADPADTPSAVAFATC